MPHLAELNWSLRSHLTDEKVEYSSDCSEHQEYIAYVSWICIMQTAMTKFSPDGMSIT